MKSELLGPLFGDLQPENVYAVYGITTVGKTLMAMTEAAYQASQGVRTLWIDTEGALRGQNGLWDTWKPRLEKRFGLKNLDESITYHRAPDYESLMHWLGHPVEVQYDGKKVKVQYLGKTRGKQLSETVYGEDGAFGRKNGNTLIVLDSMSSPFRLEFGTTLENFSGRADATAYLILAINNLVTRTQAPLIATNHASLNPVMPFVRPSMRGGSTVQFYSKSVAYLEQPKKRALDKYRKLWAVRSAAHKQWDAYQWLQIDNDKAFELTDNMAVEAIVAASKTVKKEDEDE